MEYAEIFVKTIELPFGKRRHEYEWVGESNTALIGDVRMWWGTEIPTTPGAEFWLGHLNLIVVDYEPWYRREITVALASGRGYQAFLGKRLYYVYENIKARIILTFYVWGLANVQQGERFSWRQIGRKRRV